MKYQEVLYQLNFYCNVYNDIRYNEKTGLDLLYFLVVVVTAIIKITSDQNVVLIKIL